MTKRGLTALFAVLVLAALGTPAGWRPCTIVGDELTLRWVPAIAADGNGTIHAMSLGGAGSVDCGTHAYVRSTDGGLTWEDPVGMFNTNVAEQRSPALAATTDGTVHAFGWSSDMYPHTLGTGIRYRRSTDAGANWNEQVVLATSSGADRPAVAVVGSSDVLLAYQLEANNNDTDVVFIGSTDGGSNWSSEASIGSASYQQRNAAIAVAGDVVAVAWMDNRGGGTNYGIAYNVSTDLGATWEQGQSGVVALSASQNLTYGVPKVSVSGGWIHIVAHAYNPAEGDTSVVYARCYVDSSNWDDKTLGIGSYPAIVSDADGIHLVWVTSGATGHLLTYSQSEDNGVNWTTAITYQDGLAVFGPPVIWRGRLGTPCVL